MTFRYYQRVITVGKAEGWSESATQGLKLWRVSNVNVVEFVPEIDCRNSRETTGINMLTGNSTFILNQSVDMNRYTFVESVERFMVWVARPRMIKMA